MNYQQNYPLKTNKLNFQPKNQNFNTNLKLKSDQKDWKVSQTFFIQNLNDFYYHLGNFFNHIIEHQNLYQQLQIQNNLTENQYNNLANLMLNLSSPISEQFLLFNKQHLLAASQSLQTTLTLSIDKQEYTFVFNQSKFEGIISLQTTLNNQKQIQFGIFQQSPQQNLFPQNIPVSPVGCNQFINKQQQQQFYFNNPQNMFNNPQNTLHNAQNNTNNNPQNAFNNPQSTFITPNAFNKPQNTFHNLNANPKSNFVTYPNKDQNVPQNNFYNSNFQQQKPSQPFQPTLKPQPVFVPQKEEINVMSTELGNQNLDSMVFQTPHQENSIAGNLKFSTSLPDCLICLEKIVFKQDDTYFTPCCGKRIHKKCLEEDLKYKAQEYKLFSKLTCCICNQPYKNEFFADKIDKKFLLEITLTEINSNCKACFKCKSKFLFNEENEGQTNVKCNFCQQEICKKCFGEYHGSTACKSIREEILEMFKGQPIIVCPFCDLPSTKNDQCDHVTCWDCKMELCSYCSVDRRPIKTHGNHFHRIGCKHYAAPNNLKKDQVSEKVRNCDMCKSGGPCKFPIDLESYKKEKNY